MSTDPETLPSPYVPSGLPPAPPPGPAAEPDPNAAPPRQIPHFGHTLLFFTVAVIVLLSSVPLFMAVDKNFINNDDQSEFEINLRAPEGTSLESTEVITNRVATAIRPSWSPTSTSTPRTG